MNSLRHLLDFGIKKLSKVSIYFFTISSYSYLMTEEGSSKYLNIVYLLLHFDILLSTCFWINERVYFLLKFSADISMKFYFYFSTNGNKNYEYFWIKIFAFDIHFSFEFVFNIPKNIYFCLISSAFILFSIAIFSFLF